MYLRRNSKTKMEVSIDEPLNVDWDGNELLLSDILDVYKRQELTRFGQITDHSTLRHGCM